MRNQERLRRPTADAELLVADPSPLKLSWSVGILIQLSDQRYLLQLRSVRSGLYFPGFWGFFGGGVKGGETPAQAATRELREELGLSRESLRSIMNFTFDMSDIGLGKIHRDVFVLRLGTEELNSVKLTEGDGFAAFTAAEALTRIDLVPYDAFTLWIYESRSRLVAPASAI